MKKDSLVDYIKSGDFYYTGLRPENLNEAYVNCNLKVGIAKWDPYMIDSFLFVVMGDRVENIAVTIKSCYKITANKVPTIIKILNRNIIEHEKRLKFSYDFAQQIEAMSLMLKATPSGYFSQKYGTVKLDSLELPWISIFGRVKETPEGFSITVNKALKSFNRYSALTGSVNIESFKYDLPKHCNIEYLEKGRKKEFIKRLDDSTKRITERIEYLEFDSAMKKSMINMLEIAFSEELVNV